MHTYYPYIHDIMTYILECSRTFYKNVLGKRKNFLYSRILVAQKPELTRKKFWKRSLRDTNYYMSCGIVSV